MNAFLLPIYPLIKLNTKSNLNLSEPNVMFSHHQSLKMTIYLTLSYSYVINQ